MTQTLENIPPAADPVKLELGDVIEIVEAHQRHRIGVKLVIQEIIRADDKDNDAGFEYGFADGASCMGSPFNSHQVKRLHTKAEYESSLPSWKGITEQIRDALSNVDNTSYTETAISEVREGPSGRSGVSVIELSFKRDDGHTIQAMVQISGHVLGLDEMA